MMDGSELLTMPEAAMVAHATVRDVNRVIDERIVPERFYTLDADGVSVPRPARWWDFGSMPPGGSPPRNAAWWSSACPGGWGRGRCIPLLATGPSRTAS